MAFTPLIRQYVSHSLATSLAKGPVRPSSQGELPHFRLRRPRIDPPTPALVFFFVTKKPVTNSYSTPERFTLKGSAWAFWLIHLIPLLAIFTSITRFDVLLLVLLYFTRMFFVTGGMHRYFAHRSYKLNRFWQFWMGVGGTFGGQKGPLWWASHHRNHHRYSDTAKDPHSSQKGFLWCHLGWFLCKRYHKPEMDVVQDLAKYPEIRWLERNHWIPQVFLGVTIWLIGGYHTGTWDATTAWSALWFAFFLSMVLVWHGTFTINSLAHLFGRQRYRTGDTSRNSLILALITNGEGWHNNHHHSPSSAKQGFYWWEIDLTYYVLVMLSWVGIVKDLRKPTSGVLNSRSTNPERVALEIPSISTMRTSEPEPLGIELQH